MTFLYTVKGNSIDAELKDIKEKKLDIVLYDKMQTQQQIFIGDKLDDLKTDMSEIKADVKDLQRRVPSR
jgi:hypothetical protein